MAKIIKYWDEARRELYEWIKTVADAVKVTMWPKWKNVIIQRWFWSPTVTNDWVSVAKEIEVKDNFQNIWVDIVKEAANKTNDQAWDWTTTTVVLVDAIAKEWLKYIRSGVNPFALSRWLHKAVDQIIEDISKNSKKLDSKEEIKQVATLSAQDENVGQLIADVMDEIGTDGVVTVEEWKSIWLTKDLVKWMQFDQGFLSPYFITDQTRQEAVIENPAVLVTDKKISSAKDFLPALEPLAAKWKREIFIIADDVDGEALATLVVNKIRGVLNVVAVKAPGFGDRKKEMLKDIAAVVWATVVSDELGIKFEDITADMLGSAEKIITTKDNTTIVAWKWPVDLIRWRVESIKAQLETETSEYNREKLQERLARLVGWVAVIKVWAATEMEMKNKKFKIEDALNATRAAIEEWIVTGGWSALLKLSTSLENLKLSDSDEQIWVEIIKEAIQFPAKQIAENAGYKGDWVVENVKQNQDFSYWFDSSKWNYTNLLDAGIIDPAKVLRVALQNAVSAASMVLTTESVIADEPKSDSPAMPDMSWMWGMWGMGM